MPTLCSTSYVRDLLFSTEVSERLYCNTGLPLIILMVGCELSEDDRLIDVHEMIELLSDCRLKALSREFYPPEDRIGKNAIG